MLESGFLSETEGSYELTGPLPPLAIPSTLHASLLARLDRLASVKDVAQIASVVGRDFSYPLLTTVAAIPEMALHAALGQPADAGLIYQRGEPPDASYHFKHALVQEAAYASLVKSRRQLLHTRIAEALQGPFASSAFAPPEVIGHHYACAGLAAQAVAAWQTAGKRAISRSAIREAVAHFSKALGTLVQLPDDERQQELELDLRLALAHSLIPISGWSSEQVQRENERAIVLCERLRDSKRLIEGLAGRWVAQHTRGAHDQALMTADHVVRVSEKQADPTTKAIARKCAGITNYLLGNFSPAHDHMQKSLALHDSRLERGLLLSVGHDFGVSRFCYLSFIYCAMGHLDTARATISQALSRAKDLDHVPSLGFAQRGALITSWVLKDEPQINLLAQSMSEFGTKHELPYYIALSNIFNGWIESQRGNRADGIRMMRQGLVGNLEFRVRIAEAFFLTMIASAHHGGGEVEKALIVLEEASSSISDTHERWWEAEVHRLRGELLLQATNPGNAEKCFRNAIRLAKQQRASFFELRAATSLARHWRDQGKRDQAHDLLAPVYNSFTEGFDLPDFKAAKMLLDALD